MTDLAHQFLILCTVLLINYIKALFTILGKAPDLFTHKLTSTRCRTENHRFYPSFEYKQNKFMKMNYVIYPLTRLGEICFCELIHPFLGLNLNRLELVELWKMTLAPEGASWEVCSYTSHFLLLQLLLISHESELLCSAHVLLFLTLFLTTPQKLWSQGLWAETSATMSTKEPFFSLSCFLRHLLK